MQQEMFVKHTCPQINLLCDRSIDNSQEICPLFYKGGGVIKIYLSTCLKVAYIQGLLPDKISNHSTVILFFNGIAE